MILNRKRLVPIFKFFCETNFLLRHNCFQKNTEEKNKNIKIKKKKEEKETQATRAVVLWEEPFLGLGIQPDIRSYGGSFSPRESPEVHIQSKKKK